MTDYMAQMLNELMGPQRNALPGEGSAIDFDHPDVCRDFLVGFCLAEAFRNTKNDLGFCPHPIHDEALKKRYQESSRFGRLGYEEKYFERLNRMHNEVRRKIEKNEARLVHTRADTHVSVEVYDKKKRDLIEKREMLGRRIEGLMEEAEIEGAQGNVAAAQTAVQKADELTKDREELKKEEEVLEQERQRAITMEDQLTAGNKQMQVCQVCGCFMLTNDAQSRIDDHLSGKLHIAYTRIKEQIDLMLKNKEEKRLQLEKERGRDRDDKDKKRDDRDRIDDRDRYRERDRDRKERSTRRDRSRDRDRRNYRRSRSRERDNRDRRGDRRDRSRSYDRRLFETFSFKAYLNVNKQS
uniref:Luc7-like protein 3 n=1 Tax=Angiostrongylus cantonensis TaxID=6313 RepID=A0A158P8B2_ANGCA